MTEADHGLIGDLRAAALISTARFRRLVLLPSLDSPSFFGALLDDERGGHFRVRPGARGGLRDRTDVLPGHGRADHPLHHRGRGRRGGRLHAIGGPEGQQEPSARPDAAVCPRPDAVQVDIAPRFDYGRTAHRTDATEHGIVFTTDALTLTVHPVREPEEARLAHVRVDEGDIRATVDLTAGQVRDVRSDLPIDFTRRS